MITYYVCVESSLLLFTSITQVLAKVPWPFEDLSNWFSPQPIPGPIKGQRPHNTNQISCLCMLRDRKL